MRAIVFLAIISVTSPSWAQQRQLVPGGALEVPALSNPTFSQPPPPSAGQPGRPPQPETPYNQHPPEPGERGTEKAPLIVKVQTSPNSQEEAVQTAREKDRQAASEWWNKITTGIVAFATAIQAAALIITIRVMTLTARRQLRAYIIVDGVRRHGPHKENLIFLLTVKNFGQTPAHEVSIVANIEATDISFNPTIRIGYEPPLYVTDQIIGPGGGIAINVPFNGPWGGDGFSAFENGNRKLFVAGEIRYVDAFKRRRFTKYTMQYTAANIGDGALTFHSRGNNAN